MKYFADTQALPAALEPHLLLAVDSASSIENLRLTQAHVSPCLLYMVALSKFEKLELINQHNSDPVLVMDGRIREGPRNILETVYQDMKGITTEKLIAKKLIDWLIVDSRKKSRK